MQIKAIAYNADNKGSLEIEFEVTSLFTSQLDEWNADLDTEMCDVYFNACAELEKKIKDMTGSTIVIDYDYVAFLVRVGGEWIDKWGML